MIWNTGEGDGDGGDLMSRGEKGTAPFQPRFSGKGTRGDFGLTPGAFRGRGINDWPGGEGGNPRTSPRIRGGEGDRTFNGFVLSNLNIFKSCIDFQN